jgi:hypothetical protein
MPSAQAGPDAESLCGGGIGIAGQPVVRELVPRRARIDVRVALRADLRVSIKRAEAHRDALAFGPPVAEEARAAFRAERFDAASVGAVDLDQLLALEQPELLAGDVAHGQPECSRVLAATRAVAVNRTGERKIHLEADASTEATATDGLSHEHEST